MQNFATDSFDDVILALVQRNNQLSHAAIGAQVNLSASAVRRRIKAMRDNGIIVADVALVDPAWQGLSFIVQFFLEREDPRLSPHSSRKCRLRPGFHNAIRCPGNVTSGWWFMP